MTAYHWITIGTLLGGTIACILFPGFGLIIIAKKFVIGAIAGGALSLFIGTGGGSNGNGSVPPSNPFDSSEGMASVSIKMTMDTSRAREKTIQLQVFDVHDKPIGSVRRIQPGDELGGSLAAELGRIVNDIPKAERERGIVVGQCNTVPYAMAEQIVSELRLAGLRVDPKIIEAKNAD